MSCKQTSNRRNTKEKQNTRKTQTPADTRQQKHTTHRININILVHKIWNSSFLIDVRRSQLQHFKENFMQQQQNQ